MAASSTYFLMLKYVLSAAVLPQGILYSDSKTASEILTVVTSQISTTIARIK
jgi:hypothetical protein